MKDLAIWSVLAALILGNAGVVVVGHFFHSTSHFNGPENSWTCGNPECVARVVKAQQDMRNLLLDTKDQERAGLKR